MNSPVQNPHLADVQVVVGQDNTIECSVNNGNPPPKVSWFLNGKNITEYVSIVPPIVFTDTFNHQNLTIYSLNEKKVYFFFTQCHLYDDDDDVFVVAVVV